MEETIQNSPITPTQTKPKSQLFVFISIFLAMLVSGAGVYWWQSLEIKKNAQETQEIIGQLQQQISDLQNQLTLSQSTPKSGFDTNPSPAPKQQKSDVGSWQYHMDYKDAFTIQYPDGWRVVDFEKGVGVGPKEVGEDVKWAVNIFDSSATSIEKVISDIGDQFQDRNEKRENVVISSGGENIKAVKVTVTTSEVSDWYSETVIFEHFGRIVSISNGAIKDSNFELFYKSFSNLG